MNTDPDKRMSKMESTQQKKNWKTDEQHENERWINSGGGND